MPEEKQTIGNVLRYPFGVSAIIVTALGVTSSSPARAVSPKTEATNYSERLIDVGIVEDSLRSNDIETAFDSARRISETGADSVRMTAQWVTGQTSPSEKDLEALKNGAAAAEAYGLEIMLSAYPCSYLDCPDNTSPANTWERGKFKNWLAFLAYHLPEIDHFIIGNECNSTDFWRPQFMANGKDAAALACYKLQAASYDVLKKAAAARGHDINVWGFGLAGGGTQTASAFIRNIDKAYRSSGRQKPIMDGFVIHPYGENSSQPSTQRRGGGKIGVADYDLLINDLKTAFDGTAQPWRNLPIIYGEYGVQTKIPPAKSRHYSGVEGISTKPVEASVQEEFYIKAMGAVACSQPNVVKFNLFLLDDESRLKGWQSGINYSDQSPKQSAQGVKQAILDARTGRLICELPKK